MSSRVNIKGLKLSKFVISTSALRKNSYRFMSKICKCQLLQMIFLNCSCDNVKTNKDNKIVPYYL